MKIKLLTLFLCIFASTSTFAQEQIWTKQTTVSELIAFEKKINPQATYSFPNVSLSKGYYPLADQYKVTNPIAFARPSKSELPMHTEYFFTPADSIIRFVLYDWEKDSRGNLFDKPKIWKEESKKLSFYKTEYERIKKIATAAFGTPSKGDEAAIQIKDDDETYLTQNTEWEKDDLYAKLTLIFASNTYRIRLKYYWKK